MSKHWLEEKIEAQATFNKMVMAQLTNSMEYELEEDLKAVEDPTEKALTRFYGEAAIKLLEEGLKRTNAILLDQELEEEIPRNE